MAVSFSEILSSTVAVPFISPQTTKMEALTALGLAANIVEFIQFASDLIAKTSEVYNSASNATATTVDLEKVYGRLSTFSLNLQGADTTDVGALLSSQAIPYRQSLEDRAHIAALADLGKECKVTCDQLLEITGDLRAKDGRWRRFWSFKAALETVWNNKKITRLQDRLDKYQGLLLLHFFPVLGYGTTLVH